MAKIKPFKAFRFNNKLNDNISKVVCPVYDIIDEKKYINYINGSPYNIIRLENPRGSDCYNRAKNILNSWIDNKILIPDKKNSIYIYEQEFSFNGKMKKLHGIICLVKVEDFEKKIIIPHETTLSQPKDDRLNLLQATKSNFSPIFSLYDDKNKITEYKLIPFMKNKPEVEFQDENNTTHRVWIIDDITTITEICNDFNSRKLFIADGHHRYETAQKFKTISTNKYTMMFLAEMHNDNLIILPTHRLIKTDSKFNLKSFIKNCEKYFTAKQVKNIDELQVSLNQIYQHNQHGFGIYLENQYFILLLKDKLIFKNTIAQYDVSILNDLILKEILNKNTQDPSEQKNIFFTRDKDQAISLVDAKEYNIACFLNPTTLTQIITTALANEKMPQKSTYFLSKVIAGLIIYKMD